MLINFHVFVKLDFRRLGHKRKFSASTNTTTSMRKHRGFSVEELCVFVVVKRSGMQLVIDGHLYSTVSWF